MPRKDGVAPIRPGILCPSNPYLSIAPILAVPGLRERLTQLRVPVIGVSPIVAGNSLKGPAAKIMRELAVAVGPQAVSDEYRDFLDALLIDTADAHLSSDRKPALVAEEIVMRSNDDRLRLAQRCLDLLAAETKAGPAA